MFRMGDFVQRDGVLIPLGGFELDADVVIVGSGPGGSTLAYELSRAGVKVIVVEEGEYVRADDLPLSRNERPIRAFQRAYRNSGFTVAYGTLPGRPPVPIPLGVALGGSSLINSGTALRAPEDKFLKFGDLGLSITYDDIAPFYDEVERFLNVSAVSDELLGKHGRLFLSGAKKLGYSSGPLRRNVRGCKGCGQCQFICPENAKLAMHVSYIPSAIAYGAKFITRSKVERILLRGDTAVGVEGKVVLRWDDERTTDIDTTRGIDTRGGIDTRSRIDTRSETEGRKDGKRFRVFARVVVLSAGSIYTPHIIKRSGIHTSCVGKYLTIHPGIRVSALFEEAVNQWLGVPQGYFVDEFRGKDIMIEGIAVPPIVGAMTLPFFGRRFKQLIERYGNIVSTGVMVSDSGTGMVVSLRFSNEPIMLYNMASKDAEKFKEAIYYAAKIFREAGAVKIFPHIYGFDELKPDEIEKLKEAKVKPSHLEPMAFHPLGTCRMGKYSSFSAVDENSKYHIINNLYIADGSIFPFPLGVNPQLTIMAFSLRTARHLINYVL